jgi:RHS repeat-associated protein
VDSLLPQDVVSTKSGQLHTATIPVDPSTNRLSGEDVEYDARGNVIELDGITYDYDSMNQIVNRSGDGTGWAAIYTADDERLAVWDTAEGVLEETWSLRGLDGMVLREFFFGFPAGTLIFSDGFESGDTCAWTTATGGPTCQGSDPAAPVWTVRKSYVYRDGVLLADAQDGSARHYHLDHLGSVRQITEDTDAGVVEEHDYLPYGEEVPDSTAGLRFTGHERDGHLGGSEDDLDYMHARYYSPRLGRSLSLDPSRASGVHSRPGSWNRYSYGLGNPLLFVDEDGEVLHVVVGGVVGGLLGAGVQAIRNHSRGRPLSEGVLKAAGVGTVAGAVATATFGVGLAVLGTESVGAVVLSGAAGGALGGAVQGAGDELIVQGNRNEQAVKDAAVRGFVLGGATGAVGGVVVAPKVGSVGSSALADAFEVGVAQAVASEAAAVVDLALEVGDEISGDEREQERE